MRRGHLLLLLCGYVLSACGGSSGGGGSEPPPPATSLYVRESGDDDAAGTSPETALRTVVNAMVKQAPNGTRLVKPGVTIYVGPGRYFGRVEITGIEATAEQPLRLIADTTGAATGDPPGDVILDADGDLFALRVSRSPYVTVDGFVITGASNSATDSGTAVQARSSSSHFTLRNCIVSNGSPVDGVRINGAADALLFNNLIVDNNRGVIITGAAPRARLFNNTIAGSRSTGVTFRASGTEAPSGATLRNNIIQDSRNNISIDVDGGPPDSRTGYSGNFNLVFVADLSDQTRSYRPPTVRGEKDINDDAIFIDAAGGNYRLDQSLSPAVDTGNGAIDPALVQALFERSTAADGATDSPPVDMGFHYPAVD